MQHQQSSQESEKERRQREAKLSEYARYDRVIQGINEKGIGLEDVYTCSRAKIDRLKGQVQDMGEQLE